MGVLGQFIPETAQSMESVPFQLSQLLEGDQFYIAGNQILRSLKRQREAAQHTRESLHRLRDSIEETPTPDLDRILDGLSALEAKMSGLHRQAMATFVGGAKREFGEAKRTLRRRIAAATDQMFLEFLRCMRDTRWEIMSIIAERDHDGEGELLSTGGDVARFFRELAPFDAG